MRNLIVYLLLGCLLPGCTTENASTPISCGKSTKQAKNAVKKANTNIEYIKKATTSLVATSTDKTVHKQATSILVAVTELEPTITALTEEVKIKEKVVKENTKLKKELNLLKNSGDKLYGRLAALAKFSGLILIPVGLVLAKLFSMDMLILSFAGMVLVVSGKFVEFIDRFGTFLIIGMLLIFLYVVYRIFFIQHKSIKEAVKVGEVLKTKLHDTGHTDELIKLFGKGLEPGTIKQPSLIEKQIKQARIQIKKEDPPITNIVK